MERCKGLVQYFNREGGYGFIVPFGQQDTVFVKREDFDGDLKVISEGQQVSFELALGSGRFEARHVQP
ncbi:cold shock domain-containing protein [Streptomyces kanamyceticus]|uniref:Cold shock domain-containing protein n=1 Tax=Streptomyces kanamyceticus TaxID=1967 RepID=A0A5J6G7P0_STRKN|nr:cold shock domain-containing protein [Streptomyces kanamyceticus]QEU89791.1 cold shock domain-containing protein [Streptomyces kanamyceticus]